MTPSSSTRGIARAFPKFKIPLRADPLQRTRLMSSNEHEQNGEQTRVYPLLSKAIDDVATLTSDNAHIVQYCLEHTCFEPSLLKLRETTIGLPNGVMATELDTLAALRMIVSLASAKDAIEIGTFTGMSALVLAKAVAQDGKVITIDVSDKHLSLAQAHWAEAGVNEKIDAKIGDGAVILEEIFQQHGKHSIDAAYIDANKDGYDEYYEKLLTIIRPHGLIVLDNVLFHGKVADPTINDTITMILRNLNAKLREDNRIDFNLLMIGDGLGVCRVKPQ